MMDRLAPKTAALETPSVEGDAMELFRVVCIMRPDTDRPAPAMMAASTRGTRIFQMMRTLAAVPLPVSASNASVKDILEEPANKHAMPNKITLISIARMTILFRLFFF